MPLPIWPPNLPQTILREGWQPSAPDNVVKTTQMEDGPDVRRRQRLALWTTTGVRYRMSASQAAAFKTFWRVDLNAGVNDFSLPIWGFDGAGYVYRTARLMTPPSYTAVGAQDVFVSFQISIRDF